MDDEWERTCRARSENGKKGGRPRKDAVDEKAKKAKKAVTVTDTDTVTVTATDTATVNDTVTESVNKHTIVQPDGWVVPADAGDCAASAGDCSADAERLCVSFPSLESNFSPSAREVEAHFEAF